MEETELQKVCLLEIEKCWCQMEGL